MKHTLTIAILFLSMGVFTGCEPNKNINAIGHPKGFISIIEVYNGGKLILRDTARTQTSDDAIVFSNVQSATYAKGDTIIHILNNAIVRTIEVK